MKDIKEENYHLMLGDCLERMKEIPDDNVNLVIADPPYRMTKRGKSCRPNWMGHNMGDNVFGGEIPDFSTWLEVCYQKMQPNSQIYIFTNTVSLQEILNSATDIGFKLHNIITMIKDTKMPNRWYLKYSEIVLFMRKGKAYGINDKTSRDYEFVEMPRKGVDKLHITQKPLKFIQKLVANSTQEGDVVLDPFMGSGTTGVACLNTNRKFFGVEMNEVYFNIASERMEKVFIDNGEIICKNN